MAAPFVIHKSDSRYPERLRACADAPDTLYGIGNFDANRGHFVSIVGTRHASERGRELTTQLVHDLAAAIPDLTIVSGLAYGIDIAAHRAALECGIPTIIVPGHGLDRMYPAVHRPVAVAALERGGILTEYPVGTEIYQSNFLRRNRIIAGLSDCTVVIESGTIGGSLATARFAHRYGRSVFTFPGRPSDTTSAGCNMLIREHMAELICGAKDLIASMHWESTAQQQILFPESELSADDTLTPLGAEILAILRRHDDPVHVNDLTQQTEHPYAEVSSELLMLELDEHVSSLPGGYYRARMA